MANRNTLVTRLFSEIDELMDSVFSTSIVFSSRKGTPVRWTRKTVTYSSTIYVTDIPDEGDEDDDDDEVPVVTATKVITIMDPYSTKPLYPTSPPTTITPLTQGTTPGNQPSDRPTSPVGTHGPANLTSAHHRPHDMSGGVIAAITVGTVLALALLISVTWFSIHRRRKQWQEDDRDARSHSQMPSPRALTPPRLPELSAQDDRTATPEPDSWLSYHDLGDPRETLSQGVRSPTPQPAVAEVRSYTRAWQKPRVYTVGGPGVAELPGSEPASRSAASPVSPGDSTYVGSHNTVSPLSPTSRFRPFSPLSSDERRAGHRRGY
ncbi:hypothetical protein ACJ41O_004523 [Fusarium nematophilum]